MDRSGACSSGAVEYAHYKSRQPDRLTLMLTLQASAARTVMAPTKNILSLLIACHVISATPLSQAFASEADPLLGAWRYRNETGKVVSMVLVHQCELTVEKKDICHVEVAQFTPGQAPGYKRIIMHLAITRESLKASVVDRPPRPLSFYPEGYEEALNAGRKRAERYGPEVCDRKLSDCLVQLKAQ